MKKIHKMAVVSDRGTAEISKCHIATSLRERLVGLLLHDALKDDEALLLERCNQVHTFFMKFSIDIVVLNSRNEIVAYRTMKPWRVSPIYFQGSKILEIQEGRVAALGLKVGQKLEFTPCSN